MRYDLKLTHQTHSEEHELEHPAHLCAARDVSVSEVNHLRY